MWNESGGTTVFGTKKKERAKEKENICLSYKLINFQTYKF